MIVSNTHRVGTCHRGSAVRDVIGRAGVSFDAAEAVWRVMGFFHSVRRVTEEDGTGWRCTLPLIENKQGDSLSTTKTHTSIPHDCSPPFLPSLTQLPFFFFPVSYRLVYFLYLSHDGYRLKIE